MATTVATVVADLKDRLIVTAASSEPTDVMLGNWVRASARYTFGALQPPTETTLTVTSGPQAALTADMVFYVANDYELLLPSEWSKQGAKIRVQPQAAETGDTLTVWYYAMPTIEAATTSFDTSCIFGDDWLEEVITMMAAVQVELRRSFVAPSADGQGHASMTRVLQDERERLLEPYRRVRNEWVRDMESRVQARVGFGDAQFRTSPHNKFRNRGRVINPGTGIG